MTDKEQIKAAKEFVSRWTGKGDEKQETALFWIDLLQNVLGVDNPTSIIQFEKPVIIEKKQKYIDGFIHSTKVLIEQKSIDKKLGKTAVQSDGEKLTPYGQAFRYNNYLPYEERARWIIVSNFERIMIYNMNKPNGEPDEILLKDLPKQFYQLHFLVEQKSEILKKEEEISIEAGALVGKLYNALIKQYKNPDSPETLKSLNMLCVRLVFCLYAEDSQIFPKHEMFGTYLKQFPTKEVHKKLRELFKVLDMTQEQRDEYDPYMDDELAAFPYVNGGLFADEKIEIPPFTDEITDILVNKASAGFDWSEISPTIFGAVFESTLNPETRRSGGMHYTSIENIHKVIDPLFLSDLRKELDTYIAYKDERTRKQRLNEFRTKLASLVFFDPACGSGNFLTETYLSIRKLENEALFEENRGQAMLGLDDLIQVSIDQFYGIEINDFAVAVARTALWIAEHKMLRATEEIMQVNLDFLPLKSYKDHIVEGNALRIDWESVVPKDRLSYIMGNPPFIGARMMDQGSEQKEDVKRIFGDIKDVQDLDYVTCWYKLAAKMIYNTKIEVAFVSTNSICQGAQVPVLWGVLLNNYHIHINFAHQTFRWNSESTKQAAVHCVIIGFADFDRDNKFLYSNNVGKKAKNISPYLLEGEETFVTAQKEAICKVPKMNFGNQPRDDGNFVIKEEEHDEILKNEPNLSKWLHPYMGADEFIKGKKRWCLWLKEASPSDITRSRILYKKVQAVKDFRLASKAKTTNGYAKVPHLFAQITQPDNADYLIVPSVSSEKRKYIPIGFLSSETISSNAVQIVPYATLYHFWCHYFKCTYGMDENGCWAS